LIFIEYSKFVIFKVKKSNYKSFKIILTFVQNPVKGLAGWNQFKKRGVPRGWGSDWEDLWPSVQEELG
jgi:hypothetical protein